MNTRKLIQQYVEGWKENDAWKVLETATNNCVVIESHGSKYKGKKEIKKWLEDWIQNGSKVNIWRITSFYKIKNVAVFEWRFSCTVCGKVHTFDGISIAKIRNNKIAYLREYKMIKSSN